MDTAPTAAPESAAARRFFAALPRYHQLLAQALGAIGQQQKLDEMARTAREDVVAAEQALATYRNSPAARGSRLNRLHAGRAIHRAEIALAEAKSWAAAAEAAREAFRPERERLGGLRNDAERLMGELRHDVMMEGPNDATD